MEVLTPRSGLVLTDTGGFSLIAVTFFGVLRVDMISLNLFTALRRRIIIGGATMFFQQWTGVNAILYYAPFIFGDLGLTSNTNSLLATGVVGIA